MIDILTTSLFVFSSIYGGPTSTEPMVLAATTDSTSTKEELTATTSIPTKKELEEKAKEYFKDYPILVDIARCESRFRHLDTDGNIVRGKINNDDLGLMQINEYYHADKAEELGFDLETLEGNMAYAKYLYEREGTKPWNSSSKCWKQSISASDSKTNSQISLNK